MHYLNAFICNDSCFALIKICAHLIEYLIIWYSKLKDVEKNKAEGVKIWLDNLVSQLITNGICLRGNSISLIKLRELISSRCNRILVEKSCSKWIEGIQSIVLQYTLILCVKREGWRTRIQGVIWAHNVELSRLKA